MNDKVKRIISINGLKGTWAEIDNLREVKEAGFNTVFSFNWASHNRGRQERTLASAKENGIGYVPFLGHLLRDHGLARVEETVMEFKNYKAIVSWLLCDEPQLREIAVSKQLVFYKAIKAIDSVHPLLVAFMPDVMKPEYYSRDTFDIPILNGYPVGLTEDWRQNLRARLDAWISSTSLRDIIPNMQGFHSEGIPNKDWTNPIGTIQAQFDIWKEKDLTARGYAIYSWEDGAGSGSKGIKEIPGMLQEVKVFNETTEPEPKLKLLRVKTESEAFIVFAGKVIKHWIQNTYTFDSLAVEYTFTYTDVQSLDTLEEINQYPTGDTINRDPNEPTKRAKDIYYPEEVVAKELFFGRLTNDQNMAKGGTIYKVKINVADVDTLSGFNAGKNRYIIQNSGYFQLAGQWWKDGPDVEELYQAHIRINEASRLEPCAGNTQFWMSDMVHHQRKSGGKDCTPRAFWPVKHLDKGDCVELMANSYSNNQVIQGTEPYCGHKTYLSIVELMRD